MNAVFYISAVVAVVATMMAITRLNAVHALLYLILSLLSVALIFFVLGAPFIAALEVIVYAGAIMILFIFVIMMLNLGEAAVDQERRWMPPRAWLGPSILALVLLIEVAFVAAAGTGGSAAAGIEVPPETVGASLFGPYVIGVELASLLLLAGVVGAYHLGRREPVEPGIKG